jgi:hypothetical protein
MNEAKTDELQGRAQWALALITELVKLGRAEGWLSGGLLNVHVDSDALLRARNESSESPMDLLATRLGLSEPELDLLWLLACIELDPHVSSAAQLLMAPGMMELSAQLIERLVGRGEALRSDIVERLDSFALVQFDPRLPLNRRPVRVQQRILDLARGQLRLDRRLKSIASLEDALEVRRAKASTEVLIPDELRGALSNPDPSPALFIAVGNAGSGRATLLRHAVSSTGRSILSIDSAALSADEDVFAQQLSSIRRECRLHDAWPLFIDIDALSERSQLMEREFFSLMHAPVFGTAREACAWRTSLTTMVLPVAMPDVSRRQSLWRRALPTAGDEIVRASAHRYTISPDLISKGAVTARALAADGRIDVCHVHRALRSHLEQRLVGIARRTETKQTWDDLVLPVDQFDLVIEMIARVRHKQRVLDHWGFADKVGRGIGMSALFSGPPGTGKTMIAGLIAQELGLDLYQVDLSKVVSKYIGETEKQLANLFEAAESGHAILLFDEADSLFSKRTDVKSSNDRYANLEVNYLLQRIEAFSGITIMTTNNETAIDKAFLRRLAFHVRVPMPDEQHRELIWRSMLPDRAERADDLDFSGLASGFEMSGGYIKNAMLRAAFLSAEEGQGITNEHLWRAARSEYEAMGKISFQPRRLALEE